MPILHSNHMHNSSDTGNADQMRETTDHTNESESRANGRVHRGPVRALRAYIHGKPRRYFIGWFAVLLSVIILCLPSAYVVEMPGPTANVLGKDGATEVIDVTGVPVHADTGKLLLVTVNAAGVPGYPVLNAEVLYAYFSRSMMVMPREAVFPVGQSAKEYQETSDKQMTSSQDAATQAALAFAKQRGINTDGIHVSMHVDDIGGPSAGMMYALGLIDKLTPAKETGGAVIAGTGTINKQGEVGSIGGIDLKMLGAKRDGATWFLAPSANCKQVVGHVPSGLRVVRVATLTEAYDALVAIGEGKGDALPSCSASEQS